jgi:hypothetical protein
VSAVLAPSIPRAILDSVHVINCVSVLKGVKGPFLCAPQWTRIKALRPSRYAVHRARDMALVAIHYDDQKCRSIKHLSGPLLQKMPGKVEERQQLRRSFPNPFAPAEDTSICVNKDCLTSPTAAVRGITLWSSRSPTRRRVRRLNLCLTIKVLVRIISNRIVRFNLLERSRLGTDRRRGRRKCPSSRCCLQTTMGVPTQTCKVRARPTVVSITLG